MKPKTESFNLKPKSFGLNETTLTQITYLFTDLYKEFIIRNPKKVGSLGSRKAVSLHPKLSSLHKEGKQQVDARDPEAGGLLLASLPRVPLRVKTGFYTRYVTVHGA